MYTTYHIASAQDITPDIIDSIKATFKSKAIRIIVEEDIEEINLSREQINILDSRLAEDEAEYLTAEESLKKLRQKYEL